MSDFGLGDDIINEDLRLAALRHHGLLERPDMKTQFIVSVEIPEGVGIREMASYIREAVALWCGSMDPQSPIFDLRGDSVTVKHVKDRQPCS